MYQNNAVKKNMLIIIEKRRRKKHYVLIKGFSTFRYDYSLHRGRKHFCRYCLYAFITEEILSVILKIALKLMVNKEL